jgi:hypothetical protein
VYDARTGDIKGKGVDRSGMDPMPVFQRHQQQPERPPDQRDNQVLPHGQAAEPPIRTLYTEARSPAMQYRENLEKGKDRNRGGGSGSPENRLTEAQSLLPPTHRPPVRRATEHRFEPPPPAPLRQDSAGSNNESQQRFAGPRSQSLDHQQTHNLDGGNTNPRPSRRQSLYSPVVTIATNIPDTQVLNEPKAVRTFGQRSGTTKREPGRYHSPPKPPPSNTESSPPATDNYPSGDINGSSPEPRQNRDPRRQSAGWNVQSSNGSLSTQDFSRKTSLTSNTSVSSDRERDRSPAVVEPQPVQSRPYKSIPTRLDNDQTSPPPTYHQSHGRARTSAAPPNRGSQMDSFYGVDGSLSGMKKLNMRNEEGENHTGIDEEPEPYFYPLELHLLHPQLLRALLQYLSFYDWCILQGINKSLRSQLNHVKELKEEVLERHLSTIGYARWAWEEDEPLMISLRVKSS